MDGGDQADKVTDSEDNMPIGVRFCVKRRVEDSTAEVPKTSQTKRFEGGPQLKTLERMGLVTESAEKRRVEGDLSPLRVYKKQRSRRSLSQSQDTQEPGTQSVSDIQVSPLMDPQETWCSKCARYPTKLKLKELMLQLKVQVLTKQQLLMNKQFPVATAIPDEGANPDEGATPDGKSKC